MLKIKKLAPRSWAGTGFGTKAASYGVDKRPDIRVIRDSHGWTAYTPQGKRFGETKADLEAQLN
jgi:hypothetical protein